MNLMEILTRLIAFNTASDKSNQDMAEFIRELLLGIGFEQGRILVIPSPDGKREKKFNLIATMGQGHDPLMLAGHMDTVSAEPRDRWKTDPWTLTPKGKQGERLHGLGTTDMKSFLAAAIEATKAFSAASLKRPLVLAFTHDEETSMVGAKMLKKQGLLQGIKFGIVGEPTELVPVRLHKGFVGFKVTLRGRAGHGSNPQAGVNAIELAQEFIAKLMAFREWLEEFKKPDLFPPTPTLNIGIIRGGKEPNKIPARCEIEFEVRPIPGQDTTDIIHEIQRLGEGMGELEPGMPIARVEVTSAPTEPMETPAESVVVRVLEEITGRPSTGAAFNTEASVYRRAGIETVVLGPGSIKQAHMPNEFIAASALKPTVELLQAVINRLCVKGG